jgi:predicted ferric reductase
VIAAMNGHVAWYAARSAGIVAWSTATASILWGLALSTRLVRRRGVPAWLLDLHRFLGALTLVAVATHVIALVADSFLYFGWREILVPFASTWRPVAVAWGVVAMYLLIAIEVTSWMMHRLPRRWWHRVHITSFVVFVTSTVHAFQSGTDAMNLLVQWLALTGTTLVVFLVVLRLLGSSPRHQRGGATAPDVAASPAGQL